MGVRNIKRLLLVCVVIALPNAPNGAFATVIVAVENVTLFSSPTIQRGSFDVFVQNDESASPQINGHQSRLSVSPAAAGFNFTSVEIPTAHSYVFPSSAPTGATLSSGSEIVGGDFLVFGSNPLDDGDGLLQINFEVNGGTPAGTFDIILSTNPNETFVGEAGNIRLPINTQDGIVTIHAARETRSWTTVSPDGSWGDGNNWDGGGTSPQPNWDSIVDNFQLPSGQTASINADSTLSSVSITGSAGSMTVHIDQGVTLEVTNGLTLSQGARLEGGGSVAGTILDTDGIVSPGAAAGASMSLAQRSTPLPEPSTRLFMAIGCTLLGLRRQGRKNQQAKKHCS